MNTADFLFVGVGGQGIILASDVAADVGLAAGYDVRKSEIHGMSQRGGSVESFVRWGAEVASPIVEQGSVGFLVGFELLEAARWAGYLALDGVALLNRQRIPPPAVAAGKEPYPADDAVAAEFRRRTSRVRIVNGLEAANRLGNRNVVSVVLLGALSRELAVAPEIWRQAIAGRVPARFRDLNRQAFEAGREARWA